MTMHATPLERTIVALQEALAVARREVAHLEDELARAEAFLWQAQHEHSADSTAEEDPHG